MKTYLVIGENHECEWDEFRVVIGYHDKARADEHALLANKEIAQIKEDYKNEHGGLTNGVYCYDNKYSIAHDPLYTNSNWSYSVIEIEILRRGDTWDYLID